MSTLAPRLFEARFRWVILQEMRPLSEIFQDKPNAAFDELYGSIRDGVWEATSERVRERETLEAGKPVDPQKVDLADVRYFTRKIVVGLDVVQSPLEEVDSHEGLAGEAPRPEHQPG